MLVRLFYGMLECVFLALIVAMAVLLTLAVGL